MWEFIKLMLSSKDDVSSKRTLGVLSILIYYCIFASTYWIELNATQVSMANQILYTGGLLLGLGLADKLKK